MNVVLLLLGLNLCEQYQNQLKLPIIYLWSVCDMSIIKDANRTGLLRSLHTYIFMVTEYMHEDENVVLLSVGCLQAVWAV